MKSDTFTDMCQRNAILQLLMQCTDDQITKFERMFSPIVPRMIDDAINQLPSGKLDWAADCVETEMYPSKQLELVT